MKFIHWSWENYWLMWRKSFDFRGVTPRNRFWAFVFVEYFLIFAFMAFYVLLHYLVLQGKPLTGTPWEAFLEFVIATFIGIVAASCLPILSCQVRRIRDATGHWAWILLGLLPFGSIAVAVLSLYPTRKSAQ